MDQIMDNTRSMAEFTERFINQTDQSIFLTGKAGTGKTTLLRKIINSTYKNTVVVAPTGIAALNAGGVTIHSFFQLPLGTILPESNDLSYGSYQSNVHSWGSLAKRHNLNQKRISMMRQLELLIIDEVSMLRPDILDAMDFVLKKVRRNNNPYGGVQVLFIGDLLQLPPVVRGNEEALLKKHYKGYFFFHSKIVEQNQPLYIELDKIYRQSDAKFISLLNNLRNNHISQENISLLNQYVKPDFDVMKESGFITITTHNRKADTMNYSALESLNSESYFYDAIIRGDFAESIYPIPAKMELKAGAQVMFIKNDISYEKRYYNGKIGTIIDLKENEIKVHFKDENLTLKVEPYEWENKKFELDAETGEIVEKVVGKFIHYPLKLAWAITVHKSQGLTFEKAVLDLADVFAPGQAYVGLSRLVSLDGLVLTRPIQLNGLQNEEDVVNYSKENRFKEDLEKCLSNSSEEYLKNYLLNAFNWESMASQWMQLEAMHKTAGEKSILAKNKEWFEKQVNILLETLENARKFRNQLQQIFQKKPIDYNFVAERCQKAYAFFIKSIGAVFKENIKKIIYLDVQENTKQYVEELMRLDELITETIYQMKIARNMINCMADGEEYSKENIRTQNVRHFKMNIMEKMKMELQKEFPDLRGISTISLSDFSKTKQRRKKKERPYKSTLELYKDGNSIEKIATIKEVTKRTIYNHLAIGIENDEISIEDILSPKTISILEEKIGENFPDNLVDARALTNSKISYDELRLYRASLS